MDIIRKTGKVMSPNGEDPNIWLMEDEVAGLKVVAARTSLRIEKVENDIKELTDSLKVITSVLEGHIRGTLKAQT